MTTTDTPTPPFGEFVTKYLLVGPKAGCVPRDPATRSELTLASGRMGERIAGTWRTHERWLRSIAAERGIQPPFNGRFFAEAIAKEKR